MRNFTKLALAVSLASVTAMSQAAITGQVDVKLNISSGCSVTNSTVDGNMNDFGTLDFGKQSPTWTNVLTAEVKSSGDSSNLKVQCDTGVGSFNVAIDGGQRSDRSMKHTTAADTIAYNVYQDSARTTLYGINTPVAFNVASPSTPVEVPIYGAVAPNAVAKTAGDYADILLVSVTF